MMEKKNIDRLFQEKFKDFEATPNDALWQKIKANQKKEKKRVLIIPFWLRAGIGGAAALLAGLWLLTNQLSNPKTTEQNTVVQSETPPIQKSDDQKQLPTKTSVITEAISFEENPISKEENLTKDAQDAFGKTKHPASKQHNHNLTTKVTANRQPSLIGKESDGTLSKNNSSKESKSYNNSRNNIAENIVPQNSQLTIIDDNKNSETNASNSTKTQNDNIDIANNTSPVIDNKDIIETEDLPEKKSIFDAIAQESNNNKEEEENSKQPKTNTWSIAPNVAPVYYNSVGDGSSFSENYAENSKNGLINLSYGIKIAYQVHPKIQVRSGIQKLDVGYNTSDITFIPGTNNGDPVATIDFNENSLSLFTRTNSRNINADSEGSDPFSPATNLSPSPRINQGSLQQQISYLEVPLEMTYILSENKIGISMIGGISTLFLQGNDVLLQSGDFQTSVGEGNNINDVSFSGNIGLGLNYKFTKQFRFNLEPILKYQLNAFDDNPGNFRPYNFGVYTGVSFEF